MSDWEDPAKSAAVWYVGAFASLAAVLLSGLSFSDFSFGRAEYPWLALAAVVVATASAISVIMLATRVLLPAYDVSRLVKHEKGVRLKLYPPTGNPPEHLEKRGPAAVWDNIAANDPKVLLKVWELGGLRSRSPMHLKQTLASDVTRESSRDLNEMVQFANRDAARSAFQWLRVATPIALILLVASILLWPAVSAQTQITTASPDAPIPVTVRLDNTVNPERLIGPGCSERVLRGVAIEGDISASTLVAFPQQAGCPAIAVAIQPGEAIIETD